jgi:Domain of unknown function (DUF5668)
MNEERKRLDTGGLFAGVLLMAIGAMFFLDHMGYADLHDILHDYWPMFIVAFGVSRFLKRRRGWSGVSLIVVGLWLQATTLHWWGLTFDSSWPLLLIGIGAVMVVRTLAGTLRGEESPEARDDR